MTSVEDVRSNEQILREELEDAELDISFTRTQFMYLCQIIAIYQSEEMRGKVLADHLDIKNFKRNYKKVPLADFSKVRVAELAISTMQPQAFPS